MDNKDTFPVQMDAPVGSDNVVEETHATWYTSKTDLEDLIFAMDLALANPKIKFSKKYPKILKLRHQFNQALKNKDV
jgi:hypothetical protein